MSLMDNEKIISFLKSGDIGILDLIAETANVIIWDIDANFIIKYVSKNIYDILQLSAEQMINQSLKHFVSHEIWADITKKRDKINNGLVLNPDEPVTLEIFHRSPMQTDLWLEISVKPIIIDKKIQSMVCIGKDISAKKKTITLQNEKMHLFESMFRSSQTVILLINPKNFKIIDLNKEAEIFFDIDLKNDNRDFLDYCNKFDVLFNKFRSNFETNGAVNFTIGIKPDKKKLRTAKIYLSKLDVIDEYRNSISTNTNYIIQALIIDITEKTKAETELSKLIKRYFTFFNFSPVSLWEVDFSLIKIYLNSLKIPQNTSVKEFFLNNKSIATTALRLLIINSINKQTLQLYKIKDLQQLQQYLTDFRSQESLDNFCCMLESLYHNKDFFEGETVHLNSEGSNIRIIIRWNLIKENTSYPIKAIITMVNVTDKHQYYEKLLQQSEELKQLNLELHSALEKEQQLTIEANISNEIKNRFLATMSHEFRTPLNGILGMTQLLVASNPANEQKELLDILNDSAKILLTLVNDIFDYVKLDSGNVCIVENTFSLYDLCLSTIQSFSANAFKKNLDIVLQWDFSNPDFITSDISRFKQVLYNLIDNAIKFSEKGAISLEFVKIEKVENSEYNYYFSIKNEGQKIDPKSIDKLFNSFYQSDSSLSRKSKGTGLGLALVKQILKLLKGDISYIPREDNIIQFDFFAKFKVDDSFLIKLPLIKTEKKINLLTINNENGIYSYISKYFSEENVSVTVLSLSEITQINLNNFLTVKYDFLICDVEILEKFPAIKDKILVYKKLHACELILLFRQNDLFDSKNIKEYLKLYKPLNIIDLKNYINKQK